MQMPVMPAPATIDRQPQMIGGKQFGFQYPAYPYDQLRSFGVAQLRQLAMNLWDASPDMNLGDVPLQEEKLVCWIAEAQGKVLGREPDPVDVGRNPGESRNAARLTPLLPLPPPAPPLLLSVPWKARFELEQHACAKVLAKLFEAGQVPAGVRNKLLRPAPEGFAVLATTGSPDIARLRFPNQWFFRDRSTPGFLSGTTAAGTAWSYDVRKGVKTFAQEFRLGKLKITEAWTGELNAVASHIVTVSDDGRLLVSLKEKRTGYNGPVWLGSATVYEGSMEVASARLRAVEAAENVLYEELLRVLPIKVGTRSSCEVP